MNEKTGELSYGFASNPRDALPNATFIGFIGTLIQLPLHLNGDFA